MRITGKYFLLISILFSSPTKLIAQTITSINPDNAQRGNSLAVTITGQNTRFLQGSGTLGVWFSQGSSTINASSYWASSDTLLSADFDIPGDAPLGLWNVNVWSGMDGILTLFDGFTITAPGTLSGWVWMVGDSDFGYSLDENDLVYFLSFGPVWSYNFTTGLWVEERPVGWIYVDWPFYYVFDTDSLMFALPPESGLWVYHFRPGEWTVLPRILP